MWKPLPMAASNREANQFYVTIRVRSKKGKKKNTNILWKETILLNKHSTGQSKKKK